MGSENVVFKSKVRGYVLTCWILAAFGGLMFGYDIGISGGVTAMDDFMIKFFPKVHECKLHAKENNYCKYDDQLLQLFTSSLYLAALVSSFGASKACTVLRRKRPIMMASALFLAGATFSAAANQKWMLICGRILFGFGVRFGNEDRSGKQAINLRGHICQKLKNLKCIRTKDCIAVRWDVALSMMAFIFGHATKCGFGVSCLFGHVEKSCSVIADFSCAYMLSRLFIQDMMISSKKEK